jgi:hypothetical protein
MTLTNLTKTVFGDPRLNERFWIKVSVSASGCWKWTAQINHAGYGRFWTNGRMVRAHRFSYTALVREVPIGMVLDHLCKTRSCVRPDHMEPVTQKVNVQRGDRWAGLSRTHCSAGHLYDAANTLVESNGRRRCRTCNRLRHRKHAA